MAHNRSPSKIRADVLGSPLSIYGGWLLKVDCGGPCPRGRLYRSKRGPGPTATQRWRRGAPVPCQVCGTVAITMALS